MKTGTLMPQLTITQLERFARSMDIDDAGCWRYRRMNWKGYGQFMINYKDRAAHRLLYAQFHPLAPDQVIDHLCRVRCCVNPMHLEATTMAVNRQRAVNIKLTPDLVRYIRKSKRLHKELAAELGVTRQCIYYVRIGRTWRQVQSNEVTP